MKVYCPYCGALNYVRISLLMFGCTCCECKMPFNVTSDGAAIGAP